MVTTDLSIERILQPDLLTCGPETPLCEAARRMVRARCSSIAIMAQHTVIGIWTEHDALALDMDDPSVFQSPIVLHMSTPVKTLPAATRLGEAALRFREEQVRHFLVVDETGHAKGIVTQTDVVINQGVEYYLSLREIHSVLNGGYPIVASTLPLNEAVSQMHAQALDAMVVTYPDGSHGILTERDVIRLISTPRPHASVGDLASHPLICIDAHTSLFHARHVFADKHIRHLGVQGRQGELLGLVTFSDLLSSIEDDYVHQLRITLKEREHSLARSLQHQRLAAKVFESTLEGIVVTNAQRIIESVNPAFTQITGYAAHEVIGQSPALLASGRHDAEFYTRMWCELTNHGHWQGEIWNRRRNGEIYPEWITINTVRNDEGEVVNYVGVFSDITRRKAAEEQMHFLAYHDGLTGLPNRGLFLDRLHHAVAHAHRKGDMVAVMFIDLDNFKPVNDTLGHQVGDQLLQHVAQRLVTSVREADTVARMGGDEFTVILESIQDTEAVTRVVRKLIRTVGEPLHIDGHAITVTVSVGISLYPLTSAHADDLLRHADMAMYRVKHSGRNDFHFFSTELTPAIRGTVRDLR